MKIHNRKKRCSLFFIIICLVASNCIQVSANDLESYNYTSTQADEKTTVDNEQIEESDEELTVDGQQIEATGETSTTDTERTEEIDETETDETVEEEKKQEDIPGPNIEINEE